MQSCTAFAHYQGKWKRSESYKSANAGANEVIHRCLLRRRPYPLRPQRRNAPAALEQRHAMEGSVVASAVRSSLPRPVPLGSTLTRFGSHIAPPRAPTLPSAPLRRSQRARKPVRSPRAARRRRGARSVVCGRADSCKTGVGVHFCTPQADERFIRQKRFESFQRKTLLLAFAYLQRFVIRV